MRNGIYKHVVTAWLIAWPWLFVECFAAEPRTVVLYPEVAAPVQRIYLAIVEGIQHVVPGSVALSIDPQLESAQLADQLQPLQPDRIVALGRTIAERVIQSDLHAPLFVAATLFRPQQYSGVSLAIDSRTLIHEIHSLLPAVQRVFVFNDTNQPSLWLSPKAVDDQPALIVRSENNPLRATRALWNLLDKEASSSDAILLPNQLDSEILYEVAQRAWERKVLLLSTNLALLNSGVLMVFYPDNIGMGRQIGRLLLTHHEGAAESLTQLRIALNPTVAKHLGLEFSADVLRRFQLQVK